MSGCRRLRPPAAHEIGRSLSRGVSDFFCASLAPHRKARRHRGAEPAKRTFLPADGRQAVDPFFDAAVGGRPKCSQRPAKSRDLFLLFSPQPAEGSGDAVDRAALRPGWLRAAQLKLLHPPQAAARVQISIFGCAQDTPSRQNANKFAFALRLFVSLYDYPHPKPIIRTR